MTFLELLVPLPVFAFSIYMIAWGAFSKPPRAALPVVLGRACVVAAFVALGCLLAWRLASGGQSG